MIWFIDVSPPTKNITFCGLSPHQILTWWSHISIPHQVSTSRLPIEISHQHESSESFAPLIPHQDCTSGYRIKIYLWHNLHIKMSRQDSTSEFICAKDTSSEGHSAPRVHIEIHIRVICTIQMCNNSTSGLRINSRLCHRYNISIPHLGFASTFMGVTDSTWKPHQDLICNGHITNPHIKVSHQQYHIIIPVWVSHQIIFICVSDFASGVSHQDFASRRFSTSYFHIRVAHQDVCAPWIPHQDSRCHRYHIRIAHRDVFICGADYAQGFHTSTVPTSRSHITIHERHWFRTMHTNKHFMSRPYWTQIQHRENTSRSFEINGNRGQIT